MWHKHFQAAATYTMMQVQIDAGQIYSNGTGNLNIVLETNTGNVAPQNINNLSTSIISPVIASATISSNNINKANPITPDWIAVNLCAPVTITSGDWYTWVIWTQSTAGDVKYETGYMGSYPSNVGYAWTNTTLITNWQQDFYECLLFKNYGIAIAAPSILTLSPTNGNDGQQDLMNGQVQNFGTDQSVTCYFLYGPTTSFGSDTSLLTSGKVDLTAPGKFSYQFALSNAPASWNEVYFEAVMVGDQSGIVTDGTFDPTEDLLSVNNFNNQVFTDKITNLTQTTAESGVNLILGPNTISMDN